MVHSKKKTPHLSLEKILIKNTNKHSTFSKIISIQIMGKNPHSEMSVLETKTELGKSWWEIVWRNRDKELHLHQLTDCA